MRRRNFLKGLLGAAVPLFGGIAALPSGGTAISGPQVAFSLEKGETIAKEATPLSDNFPKISDLQSGILPEKRIPLKGDSWTQVREPEAKAWYGDNKIITTKEMQEDAERILHNYFKELM